MSGTYGRYKKKESQKRNSLKKQNDNNQLHVDRSTNEDKSVFAIPAGCQYMVTNSVEKAGN